jgi:selenocysteine lyase/cysteine desulfurase
MITDSPSFWANVRASFNLDPSYIHMSLGMLTSHPLPVRKAIEKHRNELDLNPALYYRNKENLENLVLDRAAEYLQTSKNQIAITESTTMGLAVAYTGLKMEQGEEILTTVHEHYAALETLRFKEQRDRIHVKQISLYEDPRKVTHEEILGNILKHITEKTRLIALTWVHSCTGVKLPVKIIANALAKINEQRPENKQILLGIDGLHGFGVEDIQVEELGCDFFISGCHKWLFGPRGTGLVWGSEKGWKRLIPLMTSFKWNAFWSWFNGKNPDENCAKAWLCSPGGFQTFEHRWALGEAFDFLLSIGKKAIAERTHLLNTYCKEEMRRMDRISLYTPDHEDLSAGMICFDVKGSDPAIIVEKFLEKKIIIGQTPYRKSCCRLTPGILNDCTELDKVLKVLKELS